MLLALWVLVWCHSSHAKLIAIACINVCWNEVITGKRQFYPTLILLTLHFHTQVNRTFKLISALLFEFGEGLYSEACIRTWMLLHGSFKHWSRLCLIHPVYSLHDSCGKSNYLQLSSTFLLVTLRLLFISVEVPKPCGFQSVLWLACACNILPLCVGNG